MRLAYSHDYKREEGIKLQTKLIWIYIQRLLRGNNDATLKAWSFEFFIFFFSQRSLFLWSQKTRQKNWSWIASASVGGHVFLCHSFFSYIRTADWWVLFFCFNYTIFYLFFKCVQFCACPNAIILGFSEPPFLGIARVLYVYLFHLSPTIQYILYFLYIIEYNIIKSLYGLYTFCSHMNSSLVSKSLLVRIGSTIFAMLSSTHFLSLFFFHW